MFQWVKSISHLVRIPCICAVCRCYHVEDMPICADCFSGFQRLVHPCQYCAIPLPDAHYAVCGRCNKSRLAFDRVMVRYAFVEPLRTLMHDFKYHHALYLRRFLSNLLLEAGDGSAFAADYLVPVPLHTSKLADRGFNQSLVLAKIVSKKTGIPVHLKLCQRIIATQSQVTLSGDARRDNLKKAFEARACRGLHIILVDDLLTSGSTADAIASALKDQGAARVDVLCCARTL